MNVLFAPAADAALTELWKTDEDAAELIEAAIDVLEDDPHNTINRRHSIRASSGHTVWAIPVRSRDDNWVILWSNAAADSAVILYIGRNFLNS